MEASSSDLNTISEKMEVTSPIVTKPKRVSRFKVTATATPKSPPSQEAEYSQSTEHNNDENERKSMDLGKDIQQEGPADTKIRVVEKSSGAQMPDASLGAGGAPIGSSIPEGKAERGKHLLPSGETMEARETSVLHDSDAKTYLSQGSGEVKEPINRSKTLGVGLVDGGGSHLQSTRRRSVGVVPRVSVQINGTDTSATVASESSPEGVVLARRHSVSTGEVVGRERYTENPAMQVDSATHTTKQESNVSEGSSPRLQQLTTIQVPGNTLQSMSEYNAPNGAPVVQDAQAPVDAHLVLLSDGHEGCLPQTQLVRQLTERLNNLQGVQGLMVHDNGREQTLHEVPNAVEYTHAHTQTGATTEQGVLSVDNRHENEGNMQHRDAIRDRELGMLQAGRTKTTPLVVNIGQNVPVYGSKTTFKSSESGSVPDLHSYVHDRLLVDLEGNTYIPVQIPAPLAAPLNTPPVTQEHVLGQAHAQPYMTPLPAMKLDPGHTVLTHGRFSLLSSNPSHPDNLRKLSKTSIPSQMPKLGGGIDVEGGASSVLGNNKMSIAGDIEPNEGNGMTRPHATQAHGSGEYALASIMRSDSPGTAIETYGQQVQQQHQAEEITKQTDLAAVSEPVIVTGGSTGAGAISNDSNAVTNVPGGANAITGAHPSGFPKASAGRFHIYSSQADEIGALAKQQPAQDRISSKKTNATYYRRNRFEVKDFYIKPDATSSPQETLTSSPEALYTDAGISEYPPNQPRRPAVGPSHTDGVEPTHESQKHAHAPARRNVTEGAEEKRIGEGEHQPRAVEKASADAPKTRRRSPRKMSPIKGLRQPVYGEANNNLMLKEIALVQKQNSNIKKMMTTLHEVYQPPDMSDLFTSLLSDSIAIRMKIIKLGHDNENLRKENAMLKSLLVDENGTQHDKGNATGDVQNAGTAYTDGINNTSNNVTKDAKSSAHNTARASVSKPGTWGVGNTAEQIQGQAKAPNTTGNVTGNATQTQAGLTPGLQSLIQPQPQPQISQTQTQTPPPASAPKAQGMVQSQAQQAMTQPQTQSQTLPSQSTGHDRTPAQTKIQARPQSKAQTVQNKPAQAQINPSGQPQASGKTQAAGKAQPVQNKPSAQNNPQGQPTQQTPNKASAQNKSLAQAQNKTQVQNKSQAQIQAQTQAMPSQTQAQTGAAPTASAPAERFFPEIPKKPKGANG